MGTSTQAIDLTKIKTFEDGTINSVADVNSTFTEVVTKFNATIETAAGHDHDGTNSRLLGSSGGFSTEDMTLGVVMGVFDAGGF